MMPSLLDVSFNHDELIAKLVLAPLRTKSSLRAPDYQTASRHSLTGIQATAQCTSLSRLSLFKTPISSGCHPKTMLLLRPIMALSTSGAKGSGAGNSLSASASVAAILPRDSHRSFLESRDWNFVERHWAAAARTGNPALPLSTAATWADSRVDPPGLLSAPSSASSSHRIHRSLDSSDATAAADARAAAPHSSTFSSLHLGRPKLSMSTSASANVADSGVYDAVAADWQHLLNNPSFLNPPPGFNLKKDEKGDSGTETSSIGDSTRSSDADSTSMSDNNSYRSSSNEELEALSMASNVIKKKQMRKEKKLKKNPKGERATYFLTVGYAGSAFQGWASNERKVDKNSNNDHANEIKNMDFRAEETPREGSGIQWLELREDGTGDLRRSSDKSSSTTSTSPLPSVAGTLVNALKPLLGADSPPRVDVSGRTDAGVSAIAQVCSFYTWDQGFLDDQSLDEVNASTQQQPPLVTCQMIGAAVAQHAATSGLPLHVHRVQRVDRVWHPRWSARHRRYAYLMPLDLDPQYDLTTDGGVSRSSEAGAAAGTEAVDHDKRKSTAPSDAAVASSSSSSSSVATMDSLTMEPAAMSALVARVDSSLQEVVAAGSMSCNALAYGKLQVGKKLLSKEEAADGGANDMCRLLEAKATLVEWPPCSSSANTSGNYRAVEEDSATSVQFAQPSTSPTKRTSSTSSSNTLSTEGFRRCLLVELVGDRFLRRMVRVLVATAVRQALLEADVVEAQEIEVKEGTSTSLKTLESRSDEDTGAIENGREQRSTEGGPAPLTLLEIMASGNRSLAAHPAPATGLAFLGAGFVRDEGWPAKRCA